VYKRQEDTRKHVSLKKMKCERCNENTEMVDYSTVSVVCSACVQKMVGIDPKFLRSSKEKSEKKAATGFPRGWHLYKQFVHHDGRVFELGKENEALKGTLPVTQVKVNTLSKFERRKLREDKKLRKMKRLAKLRKKLKKEL